MLSINLLSVAYGPRQVLQRVSIEVPAGSMVGLIGPNGAGKSTLIRAISGVIPIQAGRMLAGNQDLTRLNAPQRARLLAVVPQAVNMPPTFTAREVVMLGRTPHLNWLGQSTEQDQQRALQAMQRTDTVDLADRFVGELSGGEQQRLLIARALAQAAPILLLDEPTSHLDLQYQVTLLGLVRDLAHQDKLAILLALHDLNMVARYADQVVLLEKGRVKAAGAPKDVLDPGLLSQVYRVPLRSIHKDGQTLIIPGD